MKAHAAPLLKKRLTPLNSTKEIKNTSTIRSQINIRNMGILPAYYEAFGEVKCRDAFCSSLINIINNAS